MKLITIAIPEDYGMVNLIVVRKKAGFANLYPKFFLYDLNQNCMFLNTKKMTGNKTSNY
jgi:hypothetical protein